MPRVLIDEDIDTDLRHHFGEGIDAETVQYRGWKGLDNGDLLRAAEHDFDVLVTMDKNIPEQRFLAQFNIGVAVLRARSKRLDDLIELLPEFELRLPNLKPGEVIRIHPPD